MQGQENNIDDNVFQQTINKQQNARLCINGDKISGAVDNELIGLDNLAKVEGIKSVDSNARVRFIAVEDDKTTDMCKSMDNMLFYIDKENEFDRYWGETKAELRITRVRVKGLVLGVNLPPIIHHFHFCRSTITYQVPDDITDDITLQPKENIFSNKTEKNIENKYNINKVRMKGIDKKVLNNILSNMDKVYEDFPQVKGKIKEIQSITHPYGGLNITPDLEDDRYVIQINRNKFSDEKIVIEEYNKDLKAGFHPKGTTYKDMGIHELGHSVTYEIIRNKYNTKKQIANDWNNDITAKQILNKAFTNLGINDKFNKNILRNNISKYARTKYSETIGEAFADYYANKEKSSVLSREIIKVMKGMV